MKLQLLDPTSVGEENEAFSIRVWKLSPSIRVLKTLRKSPKKIISTSVGLELLQMTLGDVPTRRLSPKRVRWGDPTSIGKGNEC